MDSIATSRFWKCFNELPIDVQEQAQKDYELWRNNPYHPSLHFKQVHPVRPIYSVRAGIGYRAVGTKAGNSIAWFWIGSHSEYDRLLARLRKSM